jgi:hypothetical protein
MRLAVIIGDGRDVGDDQPGHQFGLGDRQNHRRLAAHGMAQNIAGLVLGRDQGRQIGCHAGIVVMVRPGRDAVIAHVGPRSLARDPTNPGRSGPSFRAEPNKPCAMTSGRAGPAPWRIV